MAVMIPETLPKWKGEERVYKFLRYGLPDSFYVWHEPKVGDKRLVPDFVVIERELGLLVLEVKGWYASRIKSANHKTVEYKHDEQLASEQHPLEQARTYMNNLANKLKKNALLRESAGEYQGKLCFPYAHGVVFPYIRRAQLDDFSHADEIFPEDLVICEDELEELQSATEDEVIARLRRMAKAHWFRFDALSEEKIETIRGIIHPESVRDVAPSQPTLGMEEPAFTLKVLDIQQERKVRSLGAGHRIFYGVAGSGKTVMLVARARWLVECGVAPERILFLCFNRTLAATLSDKFQQSRNPKAREIEVTNFHRWALLSLNLPPNIKPPAFYERFSKDIEGLLQRGEAPTEKRYDAIFIDEAQDFEASWLGVCALALQDPAESDLVIAVDGAQSLYGHSQSFRWSSIGVKARGRSQQLRSSYRNTRPIMDFAWNFSQASFAANEVNDDEDHAHLRVKPEEASRPGVNPRYFASKTETKECRAVVKAVQKLREKGIPDEGIAILYRTFKDARVNNIKNGLQQAGVELCHVTENKDDHTAQRGVRLCTIHSAKGIEFKAVILIALDAFSDDEESEESLNLIYVGFTRASELLLITWTGSNAFTRRVEQYEAAEHATELA